MAVRSTTQLGDPVLRNRAAEVEDVASAHTQEVIADLIDSMRADNLVGMAAPQIGEGIRIFVSEIRSTIYREKNPEEQEGVRVFINPVITEKSADMEFGFEGCGSVAHAGLFAKVPRAVSITVTALDEAGKSFELHATNLLARIIQHEIDHLDGKVFLERLENMDSLIGREAYMALSRKES